MKKAPGAATSSQSALKPLRFPQITDDLPAELRSSIDLMNTTLVSDTVRGTIPEITCVVLFIYFENGTTAASVLQRLYCMVR